jgi:hypothetical protein
MSEALSELGFRSMIKSDSSSNRKHNRICRGLKRESIQRLIRRWRIGPKDFFEISILEGNLKSGFWFQIKAAVRSQPEKYAGIAGGGIECPTPHWGQKTLLRCLL